MGRQNQDCDHLSGDPLVQWINNRVKNEHKVVYVHGDALCKLVDLDEDPQILHPSDPENKAKSQLKKLRKKGLLLCCEVTQAKLQEAQVWDPSWRTTSVQSDTEIDSLISNRDQFLGRISGRGTDITPRTAHKVWTDAGGRCMFNGCPEDLTDVPFWTGSARVGYLAHIVASDPRGPRGNQTDSHRLSDVAENIMLMCDAHHRLIDSFAPGEFPAARLNAMRKEHSDKVRRYLDALAYPSVRAVTLHANLAGVPTYFRETDFLEAILERRCSMLPEVHHHIRRQEQREDRSTPGFWNQYLHEHENQIRVLLGQSMTGNGAKDEKLAVFPIHHSPTLLLAGRIMGEARVSHVFQYHRQRQSWAWDASVTPKSQGTFTVSDLPDHPADEVLITIELTSNIDERAIPASLKTAIDGGSLIWLRMRAPSPSFDCIGHPDDLTQFRALARQTINHVQDVMRVRKVHLIAMTPAPTMFSFGQMLQAGHHPEYIVYDRPGHEFPFIPAFSITGQNVSAVVAEQSKTISLR